MSTNPRYHEGMADIDKEGESSGQDLTALSAELLAAMAHGPEAIVSALAAHLDAHVALSGPSVRAWEAGATRSGAPDDPRAHQRIEGEGWLLTIAADAPVDEGTSHAISLAVTSALALQQREVLDREKRAAETLMRAISEPDAASALIDEPARPFICLIARPDDPSAELDPHLVSAWTSTIRGRDPKAMIGAFTREFVAFLADDPALGNAAAVQLALGAEGYSWGISGVAEQWRQIKSSYESAGTALDVGRMVHGPGSVGEIHTLGTYRLLAQIPDTEQLRRFLGDTLKELATRTDAEAVDLRRSLQVLLDTNLNIAETSRRLHFHYNTVRYRLVKLEQLLGPLSADPELRLAVALALRILQIRGV